MYFLEAFYRLSQPVIETAERPTCREGLDMARVAPASLGLLEPGLETAYRAVGQGCRTVRVPIQGLNLSL